MGYLKIAVAVGVAALGAALIYKKIKK